MENPCREIIVYTSDQEAIPIVVAAPGHRDNAIEVENVPDLHQVHEQFGPIGNPTLRRSRRTRRPDSTTPSSSTPPPKKQKGLGSFPISFDYDTEHDWPLSQFIPKSGRTSQGDTTPTSSAVPSAETTAPPTTMETEPSNPGPEAAKPTSPNPNPVTARPSSPPPEPTLGGEHSSSDDVDFVPSASASASASESDSVTTSNAIPEPPPPTHSTSSARSIPSTR